MLQVVTTEPGTPVEDIDEYIDTLMHDMETQSLLNFHLQEVLSKIYRGNVIRFSADVAAVINDAADGCSCNLLTCEYLRERLKAWARNMLGKQKRQKLAAVH